MWSRERISVCAYFAILGLVCSAWVSSIDHIKELLGLDHSSLCCNHFIIRDVK